MEEDWDAPTPEGELSWDHMTPDYSGIPTPEEEEAELEAAEKSLPLYKMDEGIWFEHPSPRWRVRDKWTQANLEEQEGIKKYRMVMEPDIPYTSEPGKKASTFI